LFLCYDKNMIVVGTKDRRYKSWRESQGITRNNGSYWYAKELEDIILPALSDLNCMVVTVGATQFDVQQIKDGAVIVCHDNRSTVENYGKWFKRGMIWVCSKKSTQEILLSRGETAYYIPLSVDTAYVAQYKRKRRSGTAYVGNAWQFKAEYLATLPKKVKQLSGMERDELLADMSKYKRVIAEGRCLMEAKVLGAEVEVPQYKALEAVMVDVLDSRDAIPLWREVLTKAPTFTRVKFLVDLYPYCIGDTPLLDSEELERVNAIAFKRGIAQPHKHL